MTWHHMTCGYIVAELCDTGGSGVGGALAPISDT